MSVQHRRSTVSPFRRPWPLAAFGRSRRGGNSLVKPGRIGAAATAVACVAAALAAPAARAVAAETATPAPGAVAVSAMLPGMVTGAGPLVVPDGRVLVPTSQGVSVLTSDGTLARTLSTSSQVGQLSLSADRRHVLVPLTDLDQVAVLDLATLSIDRRYPTGVVHRPEYAADSGQRLYFAGFDKRIRVLEYYAVGAVATDATTGPSRTLDYPVINPRVFIAEPPAVPGGPDRLLFGSDGGSVYSTNVYTYTYDGTHESSPTEPGIGLPTSVRHIALSAAGELVAPDVATNTVSVYDPWTYALLRTLPAPDLTWEAASTIDAAGRYVQVTWDARCSCSDEIRFTRPDGGSYVLGLPLPNAARGTVQQITGSADGSRAYLLGEDDHLRPYLLTVTPDDTVTQAGTTLRATAVERGGTPGTALVSGRLTDANGASITGASVTVSYIPKNSFWLVAGTATTGADGTWSLVTPGSALTSTGGTDLRYHAAYRGSSAYLPATADPSSVDTVPPTITVTGAPTTPTRATSQILYVLVADAQVDAVTSTCRLDAAAPVSPCPSAATYTGLGNGRHVLAVTATDTAGNRTTAAASWVVDTGAPVVTMAPAPPRFTPPTRSIHISATARDTSSRVASWDLRFQDAGPRSRGSACSPLVEPSQLTAVQAYAWLVGWRGRAPAPGRCRHGRRSCSRRRCRHDVRAADRAGRLQSPARATQGRPPDQFVEHQFAGRGDCKRRSYKSEPEKARPLRKTEMTVPKWYFDLAS